MSRSGAEVDAVVLDLGNVLVGWDPYAAFSGHLTRAEVDVFFAESRFAERNHEADGGRPWSELAEVVGRTHPQHIASVERYVARFAETLTGPVPGTAEIVDELLERRVPVYGLSNWSAELFHHAGPAAPVIGRLADVVVSGEVGLAKPDPAIFELTARRFGLDPSRTVFVDDLARNIEAARACGFVGVLFTGAQALRASFVELGVLPPA